jgi:mannose-6-phosphate isomerase-like protein (cupin superfamily)
MMENAMKILAPLPLFLLVCLPLAAADPSGFAIWKAQDLKAFHKAEMLGDYRNHNVRMNHRDKNGEVEVHENWTDVMVIESGEASLAIGGAQVNPKTTEPGELRAASSAGAQIPKPLAAGDVVHIPEGLPHQFLVAPGKTIDYFALKVPAAKPVHAPGVTANFALWKAGELKMRDGALASQLRPDHSARETLGEYGNHRARLLYRVAEGVPEQHDKIVDVWIVQSGEGILVVGGNMTGAKAGDGEGEFLGTGIDGGERHPIAAGDIVHIPAKIPHRVIAAAGQHVTYVNMRIPAE